MKILKKLILTSLLICGSAATAAAQFAPPGGSDKNLEDRNIKDRSIEIERMKRDSDKPDVKQTASAQLKFDEIKEDFEKIQNLQSEIIAAYTKGKTIDSGKISAAAEIMNKSAARLKANLFAGEEKPKKAKKKDAPQNVANEAKPNAANNNPADLKNLIVELDNAMSAFTANAMFTNPQIVSADDHAKAKTDLEKIINLSARLNAAATKN